MSAENGQKNPLEYISLSEASRQSGYTPEYLNSLARQGKLRAEKIGRNWHTTLTWLEGFLETTQAAKKEKIETIESKIQDYTSGKVEVPEEEPVSEPTVEAVMENQLIGEADPLEKAEIKFCSRWRTASLLATTLGAIFLLFGIFQIGRLIKFSNFISDGETIGNFYSDDFDTSEYPKWILEEDGVVQGEETTNAIIGQQSGPALASENYKIREIKFGGSIAMASALEKPNLEISDVRSEVMKTKGKEEDRLLIRWRTNRLALSTIEYSAMSGTNLKKLNEDSYGFNHSVVLANLEPGTAYTYSIKGKDRWANEVSSDRYSAYTGSKVVSVFDLIVNAVKDVFGWAV